MKSIIDSPIGLIEVLADDNGVVKILNIGLSSGAATDNTLLLNADKQLNAYFLGKLKKFNIALDLPGTDFQKLVWRQLLKIPYGKTCSYKEIAGGIGRPKAYRAVATAIANNPIPIIVPCHRVVRSSGDLGQYSAGDGRVTKQWLINFEKSNKKV